jgi:hypothetical protein
MEALAEELYVNTFAALLVVSREIIRKTTENNKVKSDVKIIIKVKGEFGPSLWSSGQSF